MAKKGQVQASKMQKQDKSRTYKGYELKILFAIIKIRKLTETSSSDKDLDSFLYVSFCHQGGVIWICKVIGISPGNLDSSL